MKFQNKLFYTSTNLKLPYCLDIHPAQYVLAQFHHPIKAMSQSPCFDIAYSGSYRPFKSKNCSWSKSNNIALHKSIEYCTVRKTKTLAWISAVNHSSRFDYAYVYSGNFSAESPSWWFSLFSISLKKPKNKKKQLSHSMLLC